jgi:type I restriction enzyme S subunit
MASKVAHELDEQSWLYRPSFPDEWERIPLLSMARWVNGLAFRDFQFSDTGKPIIKIAEIKGGITGQTKFTNQTFAESVFVTNGDMLFSWSGQPETSIDVFWWRGRDGWLNQHIFKVTPIEGLDSVFFFYVLRYLKPNFIGIARNKQTTGLGHVTRRDIENIEAAFPPLAEQKAIAAVLGALDDKIELNQRMNAKLEAIARALFQSWFVDFDPVRAKFDGSKSVGIDEPTAKLFPDTLLDSEIGNIPKGWNIKPVGEVVDCVGGGTPSTAEPKYWDGGTHHWTTPKDFSSLKSPILLNTDRKLTDAGIAKISSGLLPAGTLLLSSRAPVGYLAIASMPVAINQGFIALKCNENASNLFMLNWCQSNMQEIESRATGTTFAEISKQNFRPIRVVLPTKNLMRAFTSKVEPLYDQIAANLRQSQTLASIRDTLLPKLLSGELSVENLQT